MQCNVGRCRRPNCPIHPIPSIASGSENPSVTQSSQRMAQPVRLREAVSQFSSWRIQRVERAQQDTTKGKTANVCRGKRDRAERRSATRRSRIKPWCGTVNEAFAVGLVSNRLSLGGSPLRLDFYGLRIGQSASVSGPPDYISPLSRPFFDMRFVDCQTCSACFRVLKLVTGWLIVRVPWLHVSMLCFSVRRRTCCC